MTPDETPDLLTVPEVAKHVRVDATTVRRWIKNKALDAIVLPHRGNRQCYRIRRSDVDAFMKKKEMNDERDQPDAYHYTNARLD